MANLKEIRSRIISISSTMQITSAMKMVSAAKLKKAQDAITAMRPYAEKLTHLLQGLSSALGDENIYRARTENPQRILLVSITSNKGLCGGFNANIVKKTNELTTTKYAGKNVEFYTIGKKGNDILKKSGKLFKTEVNIFDDLIYSSSSVLAQELMDLYVEGRFDKIVLVYNSFKNAATQVVKEETFSSKIYFETERFLVELLAENFSSYIGFIFKILSLQGISPLYVNLTYLNPETGNFEGEKSHLFFDEEISKIWKSYLTDDRVYQIQLNRTIRKKVLDSLMIYYAIHFSGFFEPKSLEIIQQIFD